MWGRVRKALKEEDPIRVENRVEAGTPDVNLRGGEWIELKWERRYPKKPETVILLAHYTAQQRCWAIRRAHAGGRVFLLLKIGPEWILFKGEVAANYLNKSTIQELREVALGRWVNRLNDQELRNLITGRES